MYINFKSKYKKIFWVLLGFILSCIYVHKVYALTTFSGTEQTYDFNDFSFTFNNHTYTKQSIYNDISNNLSQYNKSISDFDYIFISVPTSPQTNTSDKRNKIQILLLENQITGFSAYTGSDPMYFYLQDDPNSRTYFAAYTYNLTTGQFSGGYTISSWEFMTTYNIYMGNSSSNTSKLYTNYTFNWSQNSNSENINVYLKMYYDNNMLSTGPDYLSGYKKITLTTDDKYYMLSGISEGYVFIPTNDFLDYGGRLSYYDNDLNSQPYTSYIQDYITMPDGEFVRQSFNLSNYSGADWVMFSKYIYLEGEDNITYDIYVPNDIYDSNVEITPNTSGGNNFDFDYKDGNGDIQSGQIVSTDLSQVSPLLGNIFSDFSSNTFGLTSIITAPLGLISSLSSSSCTSLSLPLPYVNTNLTLPCMTTVYQNTFGSFFTLYQTITFGIVAYWVIVKIFNIIKDAKNPDHDEIEVIDL